MSKSEKPHTHHRNRLRTRFLTEGMSHFDDHTVLELLLFYAIPQRDTNELAHALLRKFGSLSAVFDADVRQLTDCPGVGENTAALLKMIPPLARAYLMDRETRYPGFGDPRKLGSYLVRYYIGETREKPVAVYLNTRAEMIGLVVLGEGVVNRAETSARRIAEEGFARHAASFVLAHTHPDGDCRPSDADLALTGEYRKLFEQLGMPMVEHFVIGGGHYTGISTLISDDERQAFMRAHFSSGVAMPGETKDEKETGNNE